MKESEEVVKDRRLYPKIMHDLAAVILPTLWKREEEAMGIEAKEPPAFVSEALIHEEHEAYCAFNGDPRHPISIELCLWIRRYAERRWKIKGSTGSACDLGSGISSWLLERSRFEPVAHFEADPEWSAKVREHFAERYPLEARLELKRWPEDAGGEFDLVLLDTSDTGPGGDRFASLVRAAKMTAPGGLLLLDDWHWPSWREAATLFLSFGGFSITSLQESTLDQWGRSAAVARRPRA